MQSESTVHALTACLLASAALQVPSSQYAKRLGLRPVAHLGHGSGTGQTLWWNASACIASTAATVERSGWPQGSQHPLFTITHCPGPSQLAKELAPPVPVVPVPVVVPLPPVPVPLAPVPPATLLPQPAEVARA